MKDDRESWQRIRALFDDLIELAPEEKARRLARIGEEDLELGARVDALLRSAGSQNHILEEAIEEAAMGAMEGGFRPGDLVGSYRLLRELGRGGMGAVYEADRADGHFEQQVAIKLVPAGALNPKIVERFHTERQILARLNHPNIARLLDGGTTEQGVPYFVMEYVEGEPIDEYCDRHELTIDKRLEMLRRVCAAVQSAHRQLVVHRDLKPSNILVTADGTPKLLDFGIAKLLEADSTRGTETFTQAGERVMTPEYASPEQVRAEPVSTATDVYALGLLAYELLTGRPAHQLTSSGTAEVERVVCETPPERPSVVVTRQLPPRMRGGGEGVRQAPEDASRVRGTVPLKLRKRLAGDLDNIVMMALRKEPERRYPSVASFSDDVRRHLAGLPVLAHPDSWAYQARKLVLRHRAATAATALSLLALVGFFSFYTYRIAEERDRARIEASKATQVSDFLRGLFEVADPRHTGGEEITVRELLDAGALRIGTQLDGQSEVQAEMMDLIGTIYNGLAMYEPARPLLERALALRRERFGEDSLEAADSYRHLGSLEKALSRLEEARRSYARAVEIHEKHTGPDSREVASGLINLANVAELQNRFEEAEALLNRAIPVVEHEFGPESSRLADALEVLGDMYWHSGAQRQGEETFRRVLEIREKALGPDSLAVAWTLRRYGKTIQARGAYKEVEPYYRRALTIQEKVLGPDHPVTGETVNSIGTLYFHLEEYEKAEPLFRRHLEIFSKALGPKGNRTAIALGNLGDCLMMQGRYSEADPLFRQAIAVFEEGPYRQNVAWALRTLAGSLVRQSKFDQAQSVLERAIAIRIEELGGDEPDLALYLSQLGDVHREAGRSTAALEAFERARALQEKHLDASHIELAKTRVKLGQIHAGARRCAEARDFSTRALEVFEQQVPDGHELRNLAEQNLRRCPAS